MFDRFFIFDKNAYCVVYIYTNFDVLWYHLGNNPGTHFDALLWSWFDFLTWHDNSKITLVYLGTFNQSINCHIALNLASRDLFRA